MLTINSYEEFEKYLGQELGKSDWLEIDQDRINAFADATLDHQWIHVDPEKAKNGPFGQTIVHGYLTLSLLPYMWEQIIKVNNLKMMVNYGMDKMKYGQAVLSGQSVRLVTTLHSIANLRGICKVEIKFTIEIKTKRSPRCLASRHSFITLTKARNAFINAGGLYYEHTSLSKISDIHNHQATSIFTNPLTLAVALLQLQIQKSRTFTILD